ncbi:hypothetical protein ACQKEY_00540 [Lysinibacillus fusiformis]|uniref:hypothetical protein n=1 Tax=Lysinibacillus fusiformis TaxID=28031 RepID=UPI003D02F2B1
MAASTKFFAFTVIVSAAVMLKVIGSLNVSSTLSPLVAFPSALLSSNVAEAISGTLFSLVVTMKKAPSLLRKAPD